MLARSERDEALQRCAAHAGGGIDDDDAAAVTGIALRWTSGGACSSDCSSCRATSGWCAGCDRQRRLRPPASPLAATRSRHSPLPQRLQAAWLR
jgi:hypothetical protein